MRQVVVYPGEDGYWVAECPSLLGCISQGKTKQEALSRILKRQLKDTLFLLRRMDFQFPKNTLRRC